MAPNSTTQPTVRYTRTRNSVARKLRLVRTVSAPVCVITFEMSFASFRENTWQLSEYTECEESELIVTEPRLLHGTTLLATRSPFESVSEHFASRPRLFSRRKLRLEDVVSCMCTCRLAIRQRAPQNVLFSVVTKITFSFTLSFIPTPSFVSA